jgi:hypothetical protein
MFSNGMLLHSVLSHLLHIHLSSVEFRDILLSKLTT